MRAAALTATALLGVIAVFQVALAAGAPLGAAAWGGQHPGVLPAPFRAASAVVGVLVYPAVAALVLASAGVLDVRVPGAGAVAMWALTGLFALGTLANAASRSRPERVWAPPTAVLAGCCAVVALGL